MGLARIGNARCTRSEMRPNRSQRSRQRGRRGPGPPPTGLQRGREGGEAARQTRGSPGAWDLLETCCRQQARGHQQGRGHQQFRGHQQGRNHQQARGRQEPCGRPKARSSRVPPGRAPPLVVHAGHRQREGTRPKNRAAPPRGFHRRSSPCQSLAAPSLLRPAGSGPLCRRGSPRAASLAYQCNGYQCIASQPAAKAVAPRPTADGPGGR